MLQANILAYSAIQAGQPAANEMTPFIVRAVSLVTASPALYSATSIVNIVVQAINWGSAFPASWRLVDGAGLN